MRQLLIPFATLGLLVACASTPTRPDHWVAPDPVEAAKADRARAVALALAEAEVAHDRSERDCTALSLQLTACPSALALTGWAWEHHLREPSEASVRPSIEPADPAPIEDGLTVYQRLLGGPARATVTILDLLEHTPVHSDVELDYYRDHPAIWEAVVAIWSAPPGSERRDRLRGAIANQGDSPIASRHLVLRDGYLFFDDLVTADWAASHLQLRDLFDDESIVLERRGVRYRLERGSSGHYYHTDPRFRRYRARLNLLDRVGLEGELGPPPSYNLLALRQQLGLDHIEVGLEGGAGRSGRAYFLDGSQLEARLVRAARGQAQLAVVADAGELEAVVERSRAEGAALAELMAAVDQMIRENLFFDEPANEVGQQDGIMRLAYMDAYRDGVLEYTVNGVTYPVYDDLGRPRPPQVCVDFLTDAVERSAGRWWPEIEASARRRSAGRINMRDYMTYRQVRRLLEIPDQHPGVAHRFELPRSHQVAYNQGRQFFENIWDLRHRFRLGDMIVIYGLRSDERYHYHSFYVYETDPLYGVPIALADQAGHARIRSWNSLMRTAPRRYIRARLRWNPAWLRFPEAVRSAAAVINRSRDLAERSLLPPPVEPGSEPHVAR